MPHFRMIVGLSLAAFCFATPQSDPFSARIQPFVKANCYGCHNAAVKSGGLDILPLISGKSFSAAAEHRAHWEKISDRLRAGEMPPPGAKRPPQGEIDAVTSWIDSELTRLDRASPKNPGRVTARRLNRFEYNNTIRDLLGLDIRPAEDFPVDPYGYGFDNIGDVLSLSPVLADKYLKTARRIASMAIPVEDDLKPTVARYLAERMDQAESLHIEVVHEFPVDAEYILRTAWFQGYLPGKKFRVRIALDGKQLVDQPITIYTEMDRAVQANGVRIAAGRHKIEAEVDLGPDWKGPPPYLEYIQVHGPEKRAALSQTATYKKVFVCGHMPGRHNAACARRILQPLSRRAFRRPVSPTELNRLTRLVGLAQSQGDSFEAGIRLALEAVLVSPKFLFRIERDPVRPGDAVRRVTSLELASRLSYFLWSSMPDDELLSLAEKGQLRDPAVLRAQVRRMLADAKAGALVEDFGGQWLQTRNLAAHNPDRKLFPDFNYELREAMRAETELVFAAIVKEDRSILDFIDAPYTYLNARLAKHYGIAGIAGPEFRRYELKDGQRSGVLTHASVLTVSSYPTRTSPVLRGKWILETLLNAPPPPPPPDVPPLDNEAVGTSVSVRQQLEKHRSNALCASCHSRLDPLGFGLENYDAIGRWRTQEGKIPVDNSGTLPNGKTFQGAGDLKQILRADGARFARALSDKLLTYALGRGLELYDRPAVQEITDRLIRADYRFSELVHAITESLPFQMRRRADAEGTAAKPVKSLKGD